MKMLMKNTTSTTENQMSNYKLNLATGEPYAQKPGENTKNF